MKVKFLLMLVCILFLSGCKAEYKLDIDKSLNLNEDLNITATVDGDIVEFSKFNYYVPLSKKANDYSVYIEKFEDVDYYNININNDFNEMNFSGKFDVDSFNESNIALSCYEYITSMMEDNDLLISTSKNFLCFDKYPTLEEVNIKLTSRYKLVETNADEVDDYTYIWNINKYNFGDKNIYLKLDTTDRDETFMEIFDSSNITLLIVLGGILLLGIIIFNLFRKYSMKKNEI